MAPTPSQEIDKFITDLIDWRGKWIAQFRKLILKTAPEVTEEWKWGVPVWTYKGNVVASGVFKDHVKLIFLKAHPCLTRKVCSTQGWKRKQLAPLIYVKGTNLMKLR